MISYKKLFKLLIDKDMQKQDLQKQAAISASSISKLAKNENVQTEILDKICNALRCDISEIMENIIEDKKQIAEAKNGKTEILCSKKRK